MNEWGMRNSYTILARKLKARNHLEDIGVPRWG
jgi:hypothetical protein